MATLRSQIAKDISTQVSEALKEKDNNKSPRRRPHGSSRRRSRYDEFYSEYSGDSEDDYYDSYEESYSDYSDGDSSRSMRSPTPQSANNSQVTGGASAATDSKTESEPVVQQANVDVLLAKYAASGPQEEPDPTTAAIMDKLVPQLEKWFHGYVAPSEIKRLQEKAERPSNANCLKPVKINAELYYAIAGDGIQQDRPVSYIGQAVAKGCQPLASLWSELVSIDMKVKDSKGTNVTEDTVLKINDDLSVNISKLHDQLSLALMILGNANVQIAQLRRDNFKQYVHYDYHELLRHTNPLGENIFGDNLKELIGDISKIKQVTRQIKSRKRKTRSGHFRRGRGKDFLGRGSGGRGRSFRRRSSHRGGRGKSQNHHRSQHSSGQGSSNAQGRTPQK